MFVFSYRLCGYEPFYADDDMAMFKKIIKADYCFDDHWNSVSISARVRQNVMM